MDMGRKGEIKMDLGSQPPTVVKEGLEFQKP